MSKIEQDVVHQAIEQRQSVGALTEPAPNMAQLEIAIAAALTAPDHHRLKPTRFVLIGSEQRAAFGEYLAQALQDLGETDAQQLQRATQHPFRAPMLLLALTQIQPHAKVPAFEQLLSSGAAIQNLLLSLHTQGFASMWRTGSVVESTWLKQQFGLTASDYISGIIYIGTASKSMSPRAPIDHQRYVQTWQTP